MSTQQHAPILFFSVWRYLEFLALFCVKFDEKDKIVFYFWCILVPKIFINVVCLASCEV